MKRRNAGMTPSFVFAFAALMLGGCGPRVKTPADFARMKEPGWNFKYRAISSDEVTIAFKKRKNEPKGDTGFWAKVMKDKIPLIYGYVFVKDQDVQTGNGVKGKILEFQIDQQEGKYVYMVGVFVKSRKLWIFEAGGKQEAFESHRKDILAAVKSMRL
jgi:hypothetical protein